MQVKYSVFTTMECSKKMQLLIRKIHLKQVLTAQVIHSCASHTQHLKVEQ